MKLILVGKAAAGKDHLKSRLFKKGFVSGVSHTTRPPRNKEVHGEDYYFVTKDKFKSMVESNDFIEYMEFNGWYYGQTKTDFNKADVMIMSKDGLDMLPKKYREQCMVIYLDPPRLTRVERLEYRNDMNDSIMRRMNTDDEQFKNFRDYDLRVRNDDF